MTTPQRYDPDIQAADVDLDTEEVYYHGERLTTERAERIAAEGLAELRRRNLVPGRKSLSGDGTHSPTVQFRVPAVLREAVEERANAEGVPVSVLARRALQTYLATSPPALNPYESAALYDKPIRGLLISGHGEVVPASAQSSVTLGGLLDALLPAYLEDGQDMVTEMRDEVAMVTHVLTPATLEELPTVKRLREAADAAVSEMIRRITASSPSPAADD